MREKFSKGDRYICNPVKEMIDGIELWIDDLSIYNVLVWAQTC